MEIVYVEDLASYLRDESLVGNAALAQIVGLTNELLAEEWSAPVQPVPVKVRLLAMNVAARAWVNDPARSNVESVSRSLDDASHTERYRTSSADGSVFLTASEVATLNGRGRRNSVRLTVYGGA